MRNDIYDHNAKSKSKQIVSHSVPHFNLFAYAEVYDLLTNGISSYRIVCKCVDGCSSEQKQIAAATNVIITAIPLKSLNTIQ